jgi:hypothetical protein
MLMFYNYFYKIIKDISATNPFSFVYLHKNNNVFLIFIG